MRRDDETKIVLASFERCSASGAFFSRFHERLEASCTSVDENLRGAELDRKQDILRASFYYILLGSGVDPVARRKLAQVADRLDRDSTVIRPELRKVWLDCLLGVVEECDPQYSDEVERAWRRTMDRGITQILAR